MKFKQTLTVLQASKFDMEGNKGAYLYALGDTADEPNRHGQDILKVKADYDMIEKLRGSLPCKCELELSMVQGSQQKVSLMAHSATVITPPGTNKAA